VTFAPRTWVVGEVVSAALMNQELRDQFNSFFGAWSSYTPTWTASTTNPVLGNGTIVGRYIKVGRMVFGHINLIMGSTTTYGSGSYNWTLPATAANAGANFIGTCQFLGTDRWPGTAVLAGNATTLSAFFNITNTNTRVDFMNATRPETIASGHQVRITFFYESAS
jgi:hypothetical protein